MVGVYELPKHVLPSRQLFVQHFFSRRCGLKIVDTHKSYHVPSFQVASWENNTLLGGGVRVRVGLENIGRTKGD